MSKPEDKLLLYGIFLRLRAVGMELSTRDYLDGLDALMICPEPFSLLDTLALKENTDLAFSQQHLGRIRERPTLVWFIETLWARTPAERLIVDKVLSRDLPLPSSSLALTLRKEIHRVEHSQHTPMELIYGPYSPWQKEDDKQVDETKKPSILEEETKKAFNQKDTSETIDTQSDTINTDISEEDGDLLLPDLTQEKAVSGAYMLSESFLVSPLWLLSLWRRFSLPVLKTDPTHIDINATVAQASKIGAVLSPVFKQRAVNKAKLLVLLDNNPAMMPWQGFQKELIQSLALELSRLNDVKIFYFDQAPGNYLFSNKNLLASRPTEKVLEESRDYSLLVFGDLGAATQVSGHKVQRRITKFLDLMERGDRRTVLWVNPMPKARWQQSQMSLLQGRNYIHAVELHAEALLEGVDFLRGAQ